MSNGDTAESTASRGLGATSPDIPCDGDSTIGNVVDTLLPFAMPGESSKPKDE